MPSLTHPRQALVVIHDLGDNLGHFTPALHVHDFKLQYWCPELQADAPPNPSAYDLVISMGGNAHPIENANQPWLNAELRFLSAVLSSGIPVIGICLGGQLLAKLLGGRIFHLAQAETGLKPIMPQQDDPIANAFQDCGHQVLHWHEFGFETPPDGRCLASSELSPCQMFDSGPKLLGLQFHPEVTSKMLLGWILEKPQVGMAQGQKLIADFQQDYDKRAKCSQIFFTEWLRVALA
jgi:GMP synthase (glutamine-hydrolysing)